MTTLHDFTATTIDGREQPLSDCAGKVVLVVNTASECGFTPQYAGLEELWRNFRDEDFVLLGFPCDQFGGQEPGDEEQIADFCRRNYGVTFPMFAKVEVNGPGAHPLWAWLREERPGVLGEDVKWNFTKFLVGRDGRVVRRFGPRTQPAQIAGSIESALGRA
ncbi:glutathione peroxidase [Kocuria sp. LUK]|uniref:glutathione peroxidase n=1 Tax=Kocuria TaxID=57493 RepID=UPI001E50FF04|nr:MULTISPECIES: glutathione peroxidase [Kocuria]MCD1144640.1 glutathione peroxidase [Kocuria sp. LUK]